MYYRSLFQFFVVCTLYTIWIGLIYNYIILYSVKRSTDCCTTSVTFWWPWFWAKSTVMFYYLVAKKKKIDVSRSSADALSRRALSPMTTTGTNHLAGQVRYKVYSYYHTVSFFTLFAYIIRFGLDCYASRINSVKRLILISCLYHEHKAFATLITTEIHCCFLLSYC